TDLKVGVIGCGRHARSHFEMIAAEPRMSLIAIAEMNEERLAQAKAAHQPEFAFRDYRDMLDQAELDVVYVVTTPGPLLQIVLDCLARGLHTSVEKPPGMNIGATRQMRDAARKSKGKAILSVNRRYKPEILAVRHLLQERGSAVHVAANYHKGVSGFARPEDPKLLPSEAVDGLRIASVRDAALSDDKLVLDIPVYAVLRDAAADTIGGLPVAVDHQHLAIGEILQLGREAPDIRPLGRRPGIAFVLGDDYGHVHGITAGV
uniref:Gfo/Idh/MocA family protein n=1 Tax=Candidatus Entotheonella palauensis TaxID=93172 RepID=UPI00117738AA